MILKKKNSREGLNRKFFLEEPLQKSRSIIGVFIKRKITLCLLLMLYPFLLASQTYSVGVGETQYLWVPEVSPGYVEHAVWACANPCITFESQDEVCAIIRVLSAFSGTATVELVYVQTYWGSYTGTVQHVTHYKEYYIVCNGGGAVSPTSITLPTTLTLTLGSSYQFNPQLTPNNATTNLWWNVNPVGVVSVGAGNGVIHAIGIGTTTVTATTDNNLSASCVVSVVNPNEPVSISLPEIQTVCLGETITLIPEISPSNANTTLTWFSDDVSVACVNQGAVTGMQIGTTSITVITTNFLEAHCIIKVINAIDEGELQEACSTGVNAIYRIRQYK